MTTTPKTAGHTPTPWKADTELGLVKIATGRQRGGIVADCRSKSVTIEQASINAALIVSAVNSHASLVSRVEELEEALGETVKWLRNFKSDNRLNRQHIANNPRLVLEAIEKAEQTLAGQKGGAE